MGFTRFWRRPRELDPERFATFAEECRLAAEESGIEIANPVFHPAGVSFQGVPNCEDFEILRYSLGRESREGDGKITEFCKTQYLPYDALIEKCLEILKKHFPDEVEIPRPS